MKTLVNLTPHDIVLQAADGTRTTVKPSGQVARVAQKPGVPTEGEGVPVPVYTPNEYGEVEGLPDGPSDDKLYIVSAVIGQRVRRRDLVMPGTGPTDGAIREA